MTIYLLTAGGADQTEQPLSTHPTREHAIAASGIPEPCWVPSSPLLWKKLHPYEEAQVGTDGYRRLYAMAGELTGYGWRLDEPPGPPDRVAAPVISHPADAARIGAALTAEQQEVADRFHRLVYHGAIPGHPPWANTKWLGVSVAKLPSDLMVLQELIWEVGPGLIVETGTLRGGAALFYACVLDQIGRGRILTVDVEDRPSQPHWRPHPRVEFLLGSSTDPAIAGRVMTAALNTPGPVLVVLDSDHSAPHVLREMELYGPLVTPSSYLVVEDTNVNGHPVYPEHGPGPMEAVVAYLAEHPEFAPDVDRHKHLVSFNPYGYLRRLAD